MRQTPIHDRHKALGGRMIEFGGWSMPVQYTDIVREHQAVRTAAGLFDVSHMGELRVSGTGTLEALQRVVSNDLSKARIGQAVYSPMCAEDGGTVDDLLLYRLGEDDWLLVVNASNTEADLAWLRSCVGDRVAVVDRSAETALLAIQGPAAEKILQPFTETDLSKIRPFRFVSHVLLHGICPSGHFQCAALVSRTGYTGEDGFEIYLDPERAVNLWDALLAAGQAHGLLPCGLGARDTLRLEAALPLYGHELSRQINPLEAGLDRFVKLEKSAFIGRQALLDYQALPASRQRRLIGLELIDRGIARSGCPVQFGGQPVGHVTSGGPSPTLQKNIALALVSADAATPGTPSEKPEFIAVVRDRPLQARAVPLPFYQRPRNTAVTGQPAT